MHFRDENEKVLGKVPNFLPEAGFFTLRSHWKPDKSVKTVKNGYIFEIFRLRRVFLSTRSMRGVVKNILDGGEKGFTEIQLSIIVSDFKNRKIQELSFN